MTKLIDTLIAFNSFTEAFIFTLTGYGAQAIFFGTLFFGETAIFLSLLLSQQGTLDIKEVIFFASLGTIAADIFWFSFGRFFPQSIIPQFMKKNVLGPTSSFFELVTKDRIFLSILFLKFLIGVRLVIILYLSRQKITFIRFLIYDIVGTIIYIFILSLIALVFGNILKIAIPFYNLTTSIIVGLIFIFFLSHFVRKMYQKNI